LRRPPSGRLEGWPQSLKLNQDEIRDCFTRSQDDLRLAHARRIADRMGEFQNAGMVVRGVPDGALQGIVIKESGRRFVIVLKRTWTFLSRCAAVPLVFPSGSGTGTDRPSIDNSPRAA
jgi:hypothetical protein